MKSLLVTGSQGFIGKNLINKKYFKNYKIYLTYNKSLNKKTKNKTFIKINLLNFKDFSKLPKSCDYVIHLAGDPRTFVEKNLKKNKLNITPKLQKFVEIY